MKSGIHMHMHHSPPFLTQFTCFFLHLTAPQTNKTIHYKKKCIKSIKKNKTYVMVNGQICNFFNPNNVAIRLILSSLDNPTKQAETHALRLNGIG
jgi:hypothetical protein